MPLVFALAFLALPLAEIAAFVVVGSKIGILATLGLVALSAVVGAVLLRIQGFGAMRRIRLELEAGHDPGRGLAHAAMIMLAGILLIIPGFVTDVLGLMLFIPWIRDVAWRLLKRRMVVVTPRTARASAERGATIDLEADEYSRAPDPRSPWRIGADH